MSGIITFEETGLDAVVAKLERMPLKVQLALRVSIVKLAAVFMQTVKSGPLAGGMVKKQTGNLAASLRLEQQVFTDKEASVVIAAGGDSVGVPYARHVEYGTAPHEIKAVNAKALRFMVGGNPIFRKKVNHPGTFPRPFMGSTLDEMRPWIVLELEDAAREGLKA